MHRSLGRFWKRRRDGAPKEAGPGTETERRECMLRFGICDDEPAQLSLLEAYVREWAGKKKEEATTACYRSADQFLFCREEKQEEDVLLLDIDMPGMDGLSLARRLREAGAGTQIVFVTGLTEYALEGYEVEAVSYLIKPVGKERLFACLDRAWERRAKEEPALMAETPWGAARVRLKDICYLESQGHDTMIHCARSEEPLRCRTGIRQMEERLGRESRAFVQIHRSYLIHLGYVSRITRKEAVMDNGEALPVARGRWEALNRAYLEYYRIRQGKELGL